MSMHQTIIPLKEAQEFVRNNGYFLAVYKREGDNYKLFSDCYSVEDVDENTPIIVEITGAAMNFNEFTTEDKEFCFRLHNNINIPGIIPIIKRD